MHDSLIPYIKDGLSIRPTPSKAWIVYTPSTGNFGVESLSELTPEKFALMVDSFKSNEPGSGGLADMYSDLTKEAPVVTKYEDLINKRDQETNY